MKSENKKHGNTGNTSAKKKPSELVNAKILVTTTEVLKGEIQRASSLEGIAVNAWIRQAIEEKLTRSSS